MLDRKETLETALRVLGAIVDGAEPDVADAEALRRIFPGKSAAPLEELARAVVHRSASRESAGAGGGLSNHGAA